MGTWVINTVHGLLLANYCFPSVCSLKSLPDFQVWVPTDPYSIPILLQVPGSQVLTMFSPQCWLLPSLVTQGTLHTKALS